MTTVQDATRKTIELEADMWDSLSDGEPDGSETRAYLRGNADGMRRALYLMARGEEA